MGIQAPAKVKYRLIHEALHGDDNRLSISEMCSIAGVSRSGYYAWVGAAPVRKTQEESDVSDFALIKQAYDFRGYKKGVRSIYMRLLHLNPPVIMNRKKIRRLMVKYGLECPVRGPNPYRRIAKDLKTNHVADNILQRKFREFGPRKVLLTDITYLHYQGGVCYLFPILDAYTHQTLSYEFSYTIVDRLPI